MKKLNFDTLEMYRTSLEADDEEKEPLNGASNKDKDSENCIVFCLDMLKCLTCVPLCNRCFQFGASCCEDFCTD